jgi:hypothetical protein
MRSFVGLMAVKCLNTVHYIMTRRIITRAVRSRHAPARNETKDTPEFSEYSFPSSDFAPRFANRGIWFTHTCPRVILSFFFQWLFQPIQGPGLLLSSVIIFHRGYDSLGE